MCAIEALAFPSKLYQPSNIDSNLSLQCSFAIFLTILVSLAKPSSVTL